MVIVLTVRDTEIRSHVSRPERRTRDESLAWSLMLHDINFLAFAKGKR